MRGQPHFWKSFEAGGIDKYFCTEKNGWLTEVDKDSRIKDGKMVTVDRCRECGGIVLSERDIKDD